jgi:hypothetical protein
MEAFIILPTQSARASDLITGRRSKRVRKEVRYYESEDESLAYDSEEGPISKVNINLQQLARIEMLSPNRKQRR